MKKNTIKSLLSVVIISSLFQGALQAMDQNNPQEEQDLQQAIALSLGQTHNAAQIPTTTVAPVQDAAVALELSPIISAESVHTALCPLGEQTIFTLQARILLCTQYLIAERAGANRTDVKAELKSLIKELKNCQKSIRVSDPAGRPIRIIARELSRLQLGDAMQGIAHLAMLGINATNLHSSFSIPQTPLQQLGILSLATASAIALGNTVANIYRQGIRNYDAHQATGNLYAEPNRDQYDAHQALRNPYAGQSTDQDAIQAQTNARAEWDAAQETRRAAIAAQQDNDDKDNDPNAIQCTICLDNIEQHSVPVTLECKHKFHRSCMGNWLLEIQDQNQTGNCPLCRQ